MQSDVHRCLSQLVQGHKGGKHLESPPKVAKIMLSSNFHNLKSVLDAIDGVTEKKMCGTKRL